MTVIDINLTETRLWARGANTHVDLVPSVVSGSDHDEHTMVVGEPLTGESLAVSVVQLLTADALAGLSGPPSPVAGLTAVFTRVFAELGVPTPVQWCTVVVPTEWDTARCAAVRRAARTLCDGVQVHSAAPRAVTAAARQRDRRTAVVEFGMLTTTVSAVVPSHTGPRIESCVHEPNVAAAELAPGSPGEQRMRELFAQLLGGRPLDSVVLAGTTEPGLVELIGAAAAQANPADVEVCAVSGADMARMGSVEAADYPPSALPELPRDDWMRPLRERAHSEGSSWPRFGWYAGIGVAVLAALIGVAVVWWPNAADSGGVSAVADSSKTSAKVTQATPPTGAPPASEVSTSSRQPPTPTETNTPVSQGKIQLVPPAGWRVQAMDAATGIRIVPVAGPPARITLMQRDVDPDAGYGSIAADLTKQLAKHPDTTMGPLRRDVVFGGRSGLAYTENPGDGSQVEWHVLIEHGVQISIGCQYRTSDRQEVMSSCAAIADTVTVKR